MACVLQIPTQDKIYRVQRIQTVTIVWMTVEAGQLCRFCREGNFTIRCERFGPIWGQGYPALETPGYFQMSWTGTGSVPDSLLDGRAPYEPQPSKRNMWQCRMGIVVGPSDDARIKR